jgi:hypothetical protein
MGKDILGMYGRDASTPQKPRASGGGDMPCRDVMNYQEPVIPGWDCHGSMGPGIGGVVRVAGTQGGTSYQAVGGAVGIKRSGGEGKGMGTNRKG